MTTTRIPSDQHPVFQFSRDLWHPRFSKKYLQPDSFIIVNHARAGIDTYVELLQLKSSVQEEGLNCNCRFTQKKTELSQVRDDQLQVDNSRKIINE